MRFLKTFFAAASLTALSMGCVEENPNPVEVTDLSQVAPEDLNYYAHIKPLLDRNCVVCHTEGGAAPFSLESYDQVSNLKDLLVASVESGRMPPWFPDPDCHSFPGERIMADGDKAALSAWVDFGGVEGDIADAVILDLPTLGLDRIDVDTTFPVPYMPDVNLPDDYRCLMLEETFNVDTWITGYNVVPDQKNLVHHVLIFLIPEDAIGDFDAADQEVPGEGFTCFSDPGVDATLIGTWVPGAEPTILPNRIGYAAPAGSRLVLQMHYNTLGGEIAADATRLELQTTETKVDYEAMNLFVGDDDWTIPAGDDNYTYAQEYENTLPIPLTIIAAGPHMHLLGKAARLDLIDINGDERCLLDVPRYDFNWQQIYKYSTDDFIVVNPGEKTRVSCTWDNSQGNQAVVNGEQLQTRDVVFGEGTTDEMCLMMLIVVPEEL